MHCLFLTGPQPEQPSHLHFLFSFFLFTCHHQHSSFTSLFIAPSRRFPRTTLIRSQVQHTFGMSAAPPNSQGIRSVNNSNLTPASPTAAEIVYVDIYTDPKTKQECILWEDIQLAFYNALHVRHKARIIPFVKDSNLKTYVCSSDSFYLIQHKTYS